MLPKLKVFHANGQTNYSNWLYAEIYPNIEKADLILFEGGEDVCPLLYDEPVNPRTNFNLNRDVKEIHIFNTAVLLKKPILGICRGSQLVCVLSGGRLVQHQENKFSVHPVLVDNGNRNIFITSTHHQAAYPYDMEEGSYKVLGYTSGLSAVHLDGLNNEISKSPFNEVEIAYYPQTHALGIQGHPEMIWSGGKPSLPKYEGTFEYLHNLIENFLNKKL